MSVHNLYNIEGKIKVETEGLFVIVAPERENHFQKTPRNGWQAKVSQKRFATMATRFEKVDDESIEEFLTELNRNENTTKSTEY